MSGREEELKNMLREVCLRGNAYLKSLAAGDLADALGPRDKRPEPPLDEAAPAHPEAASTGRFEPRLPYRDD